MQKKSIVLLITLFFITTISLIIMKNLEDSNKLIQTSNLDMTLTQLNISNQNIDQEVIKLLKDHSEDIDEILDITSLGVPFEYNGIDTIITINEFIPNQCNINDINNSQDLENRCDDNILNNILYKYDFVRLLKKYRLLNKSKRIETKQQLEFFITKYIQETQDDKIHLITNELNFIKIDSNESKRYLFCNYDLSFQDLNVTSSFIYELETKDILNKQYLLK